MRRRTAEEATPRGAAVERNHEPTHEDNAPQHPQPSSANFAYQSLRNQWWRPGDLSPRRCTSSRAFHVRRRASVSSAEKCSDLSLFFLAGVSHNEERHCEQCKKYTRSHKRRSWRKSKRSVPTCVSVHEAQVPARHRPK